MVGVRERALEHDHREDARARADVAGARARRSSSRPCRCRRRPRAGRAATPGWSTPDGSSSAAPSAVSSPGLPAGRQHLGQQLGEVQAGRALGDEPVEHLEQPCVVVARRGVDREHARGVADADRLAAREPPVHVPGERRDEGDLRDVRLLVEDRLVQVGDRPAQRDVEAELLAELGGGRPGRRVAPGAERHEQLVVGVEREVAVHHRRHADRAEGLRLARRSGAARRRRDRRRPPAVPTRRPRASRSRRGRRTGSPTRGCRRRAPRSDPRRPGTP